MKAIYRRAVALEAKGEYDQAKLGLKRTACFTADQVKSQWSISQS